MTAPLAHIGPSSPIHARRLLGMEMARLERSGEHRDEAEFIRTALELIDDRLADVKAHRKCIARAVTALIDHLDGLDGDPDLEPDDEDEVTAFEGWRPPHRQLPDDSEEDGTAESSLASPESVQCDTAFWLKPCHIPHWRSREGSQVQWARGGQDDMEAEVTDSPHDDDERELDWAEAGLADQDALAEYHDQEAAIRAFERARTR